MHIIFLAPGNPFAECDRLFKSGYPVTTPTPLEIGGRKIWKLDRERLEEDQVTAIALTISNWLLIPLESALAGIKNPGIFVSNYWVEVQKND